MSIGRSLAKPADLDIDDHVAILVGVVTAPDRLATSTVVGTIIEQSGRAIKLSNGKYHVWLPRGALCKGTRETSDGLYHFHLAGWFEPNTTTSRYLDLMTTHQVLSTKDTTP